MKLHGSAVLSPRQRRRLVMLVGFGDDDHGRGRDRRLLTSDRFQVGYRDRRGEGLEDRSSRPHRSRRRVSAAVERAVLVARAELGAGPHVIGWATGVAA